jgi:hypothetical protein
LIFAITGEKNVLGMRDTHSEGDTPFWSTAHFLIAAAEFARMGVNHDTNQ